MLRGVLLALLLANVAYFVWTQAGFGSTDRTAAGDAEPERLARQLHPEAVQLLTPPVAASARAPVAASAASAANGASAPAVVASGAASEAASATATAEVGASASSKASATATASAASAAPAPAAASAASAGAAVVAAAAPAPAAAPVPPAPPGTRCLEAGPFSGTELALAETALAASAKTRRIARRWVSITPDAASAPAAPQHRLRIDAIPGEVAVLEALPASAVGRSFTPCTAR